MCIALDLCEEHNLELQNLENDKGYTPLHLALLANHCAVAHFHIDHSGELLYMQKISNLDYKKLTPLHLALYQFHSRKVISTNQ